MSNKIDIEEILYKCQKADEEYVTWYVCTYYTHMYVAMYVCVRMCICVYVRTYICHETLTRVPKPGI